MLAFTHYEALEILTDQADVPLSGRDAAIPGTPAVAVMTVKALALEPNDTAARPGWSPKAAPGRLLSPELDP